MNYSEYVKLATHVRNLPDDDPALSVLADALMEMGHPIGEMLGLILRKDHSPPGEVFDEINSKISRLGEMWQKKCASDYGVEHPLSEDCNWDVDCLKTIQLTISKKGIVNPLLLESDRYKLSTQFPLVNKIKVSNLMLRECKSLLSSTFWQHIVHAAIQFGSYVSYTYFCNQASLDSLQSLTITGTLGDRIVQLFSRNDLDSLRFLDVSSNHLPDFFVDELTQCASLSGLRTLKLRGILLSTNDYTKLASSQLGESLTEIDLSFGRNGVSALFSFFDSLTTSSLQTISVRGNELSESTFRKMADCPGLAKVKHLDVSGTKLSDQHLQLLAHSPYLRNLQSINLSENRLSESSFFLLDQGPPWPHLKRIELQCTMFQYYGWLAQLRNNRAYSNIEIID
jgi:hypothetical protein